MMPEPVPLEIGSRKELRQWLSDNCASAKECWIRTAVKDPAEGEVLYLDAVEEALCFGWIDSTKTKAGGHVVQRLSPRRKGSKWSELNKERCRRLERLGLMTDAGRAVLPDLDEPFVPDPDVLEAIKSIPGAWEKLMSFPPLYVRIRIYNIQDVRGTPRFEGRIAKLAETALEGRMYGEWDDGGRLSN